MIQINGDLIFLDGSGQVVASNGHLTLRADSTNTKSIIVGSGESFRPDKDVAMDLGRPDLRWHKMYAGHITAQSGALGNTSNGFTFANNLFTFNDTVLVVDGGDFTLQDSTGFVVDSTSSASFQGTTLFNGTTTFFTDLLASPDKTVHIGAAASRFGRVHASSGIFNYLAPSTSGTFVSVGASLVPERHNIYALGTSPLRWAILYAASGIFTQVSTNGLFATEGTIIQLTVDSSLTYGSDGFLITSAGETTWDGSGADLFFTNWDIIDFTSVNSLDNINTLNASSIGTATLSVSSTAAFTVRPTVNGSGVALAEENYFEVYAGRSINFSAALANDILEPDTGGAAIGGDAHFNIGRTVKLDNYTITTQHLNGSLPTNWVARIRLNDGSVDHASGFFSFNASNVTNQTTRGKWAGNLQVPQGSRVTVHIDNNGSGTVNTVFAKMWIGVTVSGVP